MALRFEEMSGTLTGPLLAWPGLRMFNKGTREGPGENYDDTPRSTRIPSPCCSWLLLTASGAKASRHPDQLPAEGEGTEGTGQKPQPRVWRVVPKWQQVFGSEQWGSF